MGLADAKSFSARCEAINPDFCYFVTCYFVTNVNFHVSVMLYIIIKLLIFILLIRYIISEGRDFHQNAKSNKVTVTK